ncbi:hypothetical protein C1645_782792 [Glomus cerebriforme]|uniref:Leucine-rich repeat-containing N-terminal plant-type domain-containing protein n=1 Tax=Glomus cerebriforme TaxID=658196 RepID=A0A397SFI9_9GLOM|nr:hypothetical protein C1645_782792 [Glomus cerebriforme]
MTLLGTTPPINFICDQCSDDQSFYNVTTFCVLKSIWTNAFNQTSIESLGWMRDTLFCEWNGIKCDNNNNIIELELKFPNIPKATQTFGLGKLKTLQRLTIIGGAGFPFGPLPFSIFQLENLVDLALISTNYTNTIPNTFDKMTSLKSLRIANNYQLNSFIIPDTISTTSLVTLVFSLQNVNGAIPDFIGNSITLQNSLQNLDLSSNNLTGNIPNSLFNLRNLQSLRLGTNSLTGQIPPGLTSSKFTNSLTSIDLSANWFSGNIPASLNKFVNLISLNLETNLLTGPIPAELSTLNLNDLILENNQLSGSIPDSIGNINLRNLRLRNNTLTGFIPPSICQRRTYAFCTMGQNQFQVQTGLSCGDCAFG